MPRVVDQLLILNKVYTQDNCFVQTSDHIEFLVDGFLAYLNLKLVPALALQILSVCSLEVSFRLVKDLGRPSLYRDATKSFFRYARNVGPGIIQGPKRHSRLQLNSYERTTEHFVCGTFYFVTNFVKQGIGNISNIVLGLVPVTTKRGVFVATYQFKWAIPLTAAATSWIGAG